MYLYCANAPVFRRDDNGKSFFEHFFFRLMHHQQYEFWEEVACGLLLAGFEFSADFLFNSLREHPTNRCYHNNSSLAKRIKQNKEFQRKVDQAISTGSLGPFGVVFENDMDLFGAIHRASFVVIPVKGNDEKARYHIKMYDKYDFDYIESYSISSSSLMKSLFIYAGIEGNNLAVTSMEDGVLREFNIHVDFFVDISFKE